MKSEIDRLSHRGCDYGDSARGQRRENLGCDATLPLVAKTMGNCTFHIRAALPLAPSYGAIRFAVITDLHWQTLDAHILPYMHMEVGTVPRQRGL